MESALESALAGDHARAAGDDAYLPADLPLEPGSGKPNLAALLREHSDRGAPRGSEADAPEGPRDRKADFIAAARRAAQAAASEIEAERLGSSAAPEDGATGGRRSLLDRLKGGASRKADSAEPAEFGAEIVDEATGLGAATDDKPKSLLRRVLRSRRPIVLAAAAVILAIGALKMATPERIDQITSLIAKPASMMSATTAPQKASPTAIAPTTASPAEPVRDPAGPRTSAPPSQSTARSDTTGTVLPDAVASRPDDQIAFQPPLAARVASRRPRLPWRRVFLPGPPGPA
ncbi:hypothetical protein D1F64_05810 [Breoghania sp. L-A4]|nr:hypothetical protein D1F64_05810 [Breoghania sp. L-A4]